MKIIVDTNIWYYIGDNKIDPKTFEGHELIVTFTNVSELSKTKNIIDKYEYTRNAIVAMFKNKSQELFDPPIIHLAKLADPDFKYDILEEHQGIFKFTTQIANRYKIDKDKEEEFMIQAGKVEKELQGAADFFTYHAKEEIKPNIKDKKAHRKEDPTPINRELLDFFVKQATGGKQDLSKIDWNKIELLEKTLRVFFNEIELSGMKIQGNDWNDLFLLSYVQPGMKIWTSEGRWLTMIKKAKMEDYLFEV